ncbi:MAG: KEOPS complex subunit Pcc1 [Methanocellales archaeon]|nr:KEOPS complex subunit Pcc1 [Methanocellales archaeon]MDD3421805.1 KEOPS complex subunit Pcc1 [Methanocellales archaeon]MDD4898546.1 KEOPS complex subunit Pcc1 [Methanocellales archaeon]MDD5447114.1 KEOPS complex subunit Pcc1 [Methanocellales archaeon]
MSDCKCSGKIVTSHKRCHIIMEAIRPDNTLNMRTTCKNGEIITEFEIDGIGTLIATVDDYLLNLKIAEEIGSE